MANIFFSFAFRRRPLQSKLNVSSLDKRAEKSELDSNPRRQILRLREPPSLPELEIPNNYFNKTNNKTSNQKTKQISFLEKKKLGNLNNQIVFYRIITKLTTFASGKSKNRVKFTPPQWLNI